LVLALTLDTQLDQSLLFVGHRSTTGRASRDDRDGMKPATVSTDPSIAVVVALSRERFRWPVSEPVVRI
jgi:hypothetical protein